MSEFDTLLTGNIIRKINGLHANIVPKSSKGFQERSPGFSVYPSNTMILFIGS